MFHLGDFKRYFAEKYTEQIFGITEKEYDINNLKFNMADPIWMTFI